MGLAVGPSDGTADGRPVTGLVGRRVRPGPLPAWADLSCTPADLCDVLAALLQGEHDALAAALRDERLPMEALVMLVERHRLGCHLAARLVHSPLLPLVPKQLWDAIQERQRQQAQRTSRMLEALQRLLPRFKHAGIETMVVKGPELAARFSGGLLQRGYGDLDLLVRGQDRRAALDLLMKLGFQLRSRVLLSRSVTARFVHGFDFEHQGLRLDLHWCLSRQPGFRIDETGFWARRTHWSLDGVTVAVPAAVDELHFLLISAFADLQRGALRLQSLVDVTMLVDALEAFDGKTFLLDRNSEGTAEVCRLMLGVQQVLLSSKRPGPAWASALEPLPNRQHLLQLLQPAPFDLPLKLWSAPHLPVSPLHYGLWWLLSLPFRTASSHPSLRSRSLPAGAVQ